MLKLFVCKNVNNPSLLHILPYKVTRLKHTLPVFISKRIEIAKQVDGLRVIHVRHINKYRPPPGVTPVEPKPIPFVQQGMRPQQRGYWLLIVPIITFGLGTWQVRRLQWKTKLIEDIKTRTTMEPVPLELPIEPEELAALELRRVIVKGTFDHNKEIYYGPKPCLVNGEPNSEVISKTGERSYGFNLVTPFVISDSGERILVNRGWIQTKMVNPDKRPWSRTEGEHVITGIVRVTEPPSIIGPTKNPKYKTWHYRDIEDMASKTNCLPIYVDATVEHSIPNLLWAGQTTTTLRNEHLTYIITWYSLSIATAILWRKLCFK